MGFVRKTTSTRERSGGPHVVFSQIDAGHLTIASLGEVSRRAADAAADIEQFDALGKTEIAGKFDRRMAPAEVEFVGTGKIGCDQPVDVLAAGRERLQDRLFETWTAVVLRDLLLGLHGRTPSIGELPGAYHAWGRKSGGRSAPQIYRRCFWLLLFDRGLSDTAIRMPVHAQPHSGDFNFPR